MRRGGGARGRRRRARGKHGGVQRGERQSPRGDGELFDVRAVRGATRARSVRAKYGRVRTRRSAVRRRCRRAKHGSTRAPIRFDGVRKSKPRRTREYATGRAPLRRFTRVSPARRVGVRVRPFRRVRLRRRPRLFRVRARRRVRHADGADAGAHDGNAEGTRQRTRTRQCGGDRGRCGRRRGPPP